MENAAVARFFRDMASILEIKGENVFRIRAYERAAQNIEGLSEDVGKLAKEGKLKEIPGIGTDLANKITEIATTGKLKAYEELKKSISPCLYPVLSYKYMGVCCQFRQEF